MAVEKKLTAQEKALLEAEKAFQKKIDDRREALKKELKVEDVFSLRVGDKVAYVKKPDRKILSMARATGGGDEIVIAEVILDEIWIEGDEVIRTNDDYFLNAIPFLNNLIEAKKVELKKN